MASTSPFKLISTSTALAIIAPQEFHQDINSLRRLHDKAYRKWEPHINLLYPFVETSQLAAAVSILRQHLFDGQYEALQVNLNQVDSFTHRRNATVFLKPSVVSESSISRLRNNLAKALGCEDSEGTHDGIFRPHMTIGQAGLTGTQLERLSEKVESLAGIAWEGRSLVVLKREPTGEMRMMEELPFGVSPDERQVGSEVLPVYDGYKECFSFYHETGWILDKPDITKEDQMRRAPFEMAVATYNLMADESAPSFAKRLPLITESIRSVTESSRAELQVLCLQEVNSEMLPLILAIPLIQQYYPHSSHSPVSLLPSHRNLVSFCSKPFRHSKIDFDERHKTMLDIRIIGFPVRVVNVHLSSALSDESVAVKLRQMEKVTSFTKGTNASDSREIIVAGDFNLTTSSRTIHTALFKKLIKVETAQLIAKVIDLSIWEDSFVSCNLGNMTDQEIVEGEMGATFDRSSNPLAAIPEPPIDRSPQRYDRVLFRKGGYVTAEAVERFGFPNKFGEVGSDHYGVCATFGIGQAELIDSLPGKDEPNQIDVIEDCKDITLLIEPYLPTEEDRKQRVNALELLKQTLSHDMMLNDLILAPLGSYLMDTYFADSDVDVLAIGSIAPKIFFDCASARLQELAVREENENNFKGVHFVNSLVSIIELSVLGIKFDLQYCQAPELVERCYASGSVSHASNTEYRYYEIGPTPDLATLVLDTKLISKLAPSSIRPLNTYRDTAHLLNTISDISSFRQAHRFLSLYLKRRGLYSAKFGYLGGIHLSLMLNRAVKLVSSTTSYKSRIISSAMIIRTFFIYYASFDWAKAVITDPSVYSKPTRSAREAVFIHAIHTPTARPNVASSCTRLSAQTFTTEFTLAAKHLEEGNWLWCLRSRQDVIADFLGTFGAFVKISIDVWDIDEIHGGKIREFVGGLESKLTRLLVGLGRLPNVDARIWPARFRAPFSSLGTSAEQRGFTEEETTQFKGMYLVGISAHEEDAERKRILTGKIVGTIREFEINVREGREMQGMDSNVWLKMDLTSKKKIVEMGLVPDDRDWGARVAKEAFLRPSSYSDLGEPDEPISSLTLSTHPRPHHHKSSSASLRPAQDIISRIKWDPTLRIEDFLIGYEDRFVGVKEMDLSNWKSEQTDEEFIPMHRIVWVRQKDREGDGAREGIKVWDRRKKLDLIFGSGVFVGTS